MDNFSGFILVLDEPIRKKKIQKIIAQSGTFTEALSIPDWKLKQSAVAFLCLDSNELSYICMARKGNKAVTAKNRIHFSDFIPLNNLKITQIENNLNQNLKLHFSKSTSGNGRNIPKTTLHATIAAIVNFRPEQKPDIDNLLKKIQASGQILTGQNAQRLIQEREAVGIALDIFSPGGALRNKTLRTWRHDTSETLEGQNACYLNGLSLSFLNEESAILHDLQNFPGFASEDRKSVGGHSTFKQGNRQLDIIYSNRNQMEKTLGVDLIYYNSRYNSFILIQYKIMKKNREKSEHYFRPDDQADKELARMNDYHTRTSHLVSEINNENLRLSRDGFFFKLVATDSLELDDGRLSPGMYLSREYVNYLFGEKGPKGSQGGRKITFQNSPRSLNNSEFATLVSQGWIGTSGGTSQDMASLLRLIANPNNAQYYAYETTLPIDHLNNHLDEIDE